MDRIHNCSAVITDYCIKFLCFYLFGLNKKMLGSYFTYSDLKLLFETGKQVDGLQLQTRVSDSLAFISQAGQKLEHRKR